MSRRLSAGKCRDRQGDPDGVVASVATTIKSVATAATTIKSVATAATLAKTMYRRYTGKAVQPAGWTATVALRATSLSLNLPVGFTACS